jgi:hypothetical protein
MSRPRSITMENAGITWTTGDYMMVLEHQGNGS